MSCVMCANTSTSLHIACEFECLSANECCQCQLRGGRTLARCLANCASEPMSSRAGSGSLTYPECLTGHKVKWNETRVSLRRQDGIFKSSPVNSCFVYLSIARLHSVHGALKRLWRGSGCRTLTVQTLVQTNTGTVYKHYVTIVI